MSQGVVSNSAAADELARASFRSYNGGVPRGPAASESPGSEPRPRSAPSVRPP